MHQAKILDQSSKILLSIIVVLTFGYFCMAHSSTAFMMIWVFVLLISLVRASWRTLIFIGPQYLRTNRRSRRRSKQPKTKPQKSNRGIETDESFAWSSNVNERNKSTKISLESYLANADYQLSDKILEAIEWKRFELLCHYIFEAKGYISKLTPDGPDEGVDIRIYDRSESKTVQYLVQCKKFAMHNKVGRPTIQQLKGQMASEGVEKGGFCTTSSFTPPALDFAKNNNIEPFDRYHITMSFSELTADVRKAILCKILEGDYWTPSCASCGEKLNSMKSKNGDLFWGCKNFGRHGGKGLKFFDARPIDTTLRGR